jgi:hypothetical protein
MLQGSPCPSSSSAAAAPGSSAAAVGSNEDIEASIRQLELQGRPAGETDASGNSGSVAGAAAAGSSAASSDTGVSQSRASSSIRVAKFHKVLNESLVRGSTCSVQQQLSCKSKHAQVQDNRRCTWPRGCAGCYHAADCWSQLPARGCLVADACLPLTTRACCFCGGGRMWRPAGGP